MKIGDLVRIKKEYSLRNEVGVIVEPVFPESKTNLGKAWKVMFANGKVLGKLTKSLEVINESR